MRGREIDRRPDRNDASRVYLPLAAVVMPFDVINAHGLGYSRYLIEIARVIPQIRIVGDAPQIAFEMAVIDRVDLHQRLV